MMNGFPTAADFNARRVTNPSQSEVIRQRLYDFQIAPSAGVTQLTFFQSPIGQGTTSAVGATVGTAKTFFDTNMELGGQLPSGKSFLIESIEVVFFPGATATGYIPQADGYVGVSATLAQVADLNDVNIFYQSGLVELNVLSKNYVRETPAIAFPPKANFDLSASTSVVTAGNNVQGANLLKVGGRPFFVEPSIALQPAVNFEVVIRYPAAVALPSGFNGRVGVILDGYLMRASQ
jgi:hypothetical protein